MHQWQLLVYSNDCKSDEEIHHFLFYLDIFCSVKVFMRVDKTV